MATTKEYGLRYSVIGRKGIITNKEKWFKTAHQRGVFVDKLMEAGTLHRVHAYSNP